MYVYIYGYGNVLCDNILNCVDTSSKMEIERYQENVIYSTLCTICITVTIYICT